MTEKEEFWLGKLANLNASRSKGRGIAPHKPLMLLVVLELFEAGEICEGQVIYDVRLVQRFRDLWPIVFERQRNAPDIPMPFHALGSARDQVWKTFTREGQQSHAKGATRMCEMNPDLLICLGSERFRREAKNILISQYFLPLEQVALYRRFQLPIPRPEKIREMGVDAKAFRESEKRGRSSRFKTEVVSQYRYTCALTGYRLDFENGFLVQAAHIHQHARGGADRAENGLALSPNAHWMFDAGLWAVAPDLSIRVAVGCFEDSGPSGESLKDFHEKPLHFHRSASLRPSLANLEWHWENVFLGRKSLENSS